MMKSLDKFDEKYFLKYKVKPVKLRPYDPKQKLIAKKYLSTLKKLLGGFEVELLIRGSTAFENSGKGDVEMGIYPVNNHKWEKILSKLENSFGKPGNLEDNYARFNLEDEGFEIEIIVLKGYEAKLDKALTLYLQKQPEPLLEYEKLKEKYSFSKREYQIQKNEFFTKVSKLIPDDYLNNLTPLSKK